MVMPSSSSYAILAEHLVLATPDNGVATALYAACKAVVKVADGKKITLHEETNYPFEEDIRFLSLPREKSSFRSISESFMDSKGESMREW